MVGMARTAASHHAYLGETTSVPSVDEAVACGARGLKLVVWLGRGRVCLPGDSLPLRVHAGPYVAAVEGLISGGSAESFGYLSLRAPATPLPTVCRQALGRAQSTCVARRELLGGTQVGTLLRITKFRRSEDGGLVLLCLAVGRFSIVRRMLCVDVVPACLRVYVCVRSVSCVHVCMCMCMCFFQCALVRVCMCVSLYV